jgi:hypothetical protein
MDNSAEEAGGTAHGLNAYSETADRRTLDSLDRVMMTVAQWIKATAGCFLGHVKMAVVTDGRTMTLNLTDLGTGVEHHGSLMVGAHAEIRFMAAVVDVDRSELADRMRDALVSNGFQLKHKNIVELG